VPDDSLWPLAIGSSWTLTGGSGANSETACTETYSVTDFGAFEGKDAFTVSVDWCDERPNSTEHYAPGEVDELFRYVGGEWVVLYKGPIDSQQSFDVGSDHYVWNYGERPPGFGVSNDPCWRLQMPTTSNGFLLEFCRNLGLVRVVRDDVSDDHDVDVTLTSYTPPG
jgi:hypothetical protein